MNVSFYYLVVNFYASCFCDAVCVYGWFTLRSSVLLNYPLENWCWVHTHCLAKFRTTDNFIYFFWVRGTIESTFFYCGDSSVGSSAQVLTHSCASGEDSRRNWHKAFGPWPPACRHPLRQRLGDIVYWDQLAI